MIANLARGIIGETPSNLMGALLLARVQAAGMARASLPQEARTPFHIVIDEVQLFGTEVIAQILSEARKYGLSLTMATQFMAGLSEKTRAAVMGNVAALIVFRVGHEDAIVLAPEFDRAHQAFNPYALAAAAARRSHGAHLKRRGRACGDASRSPAMRMRRARQTDKAASTMAYA